MEGNLVARPRRPGLDILIGVAILLVRIDLLACLAGCAGTFGFPFELCTHWTPAGALLLAAGCPLLWWRKKRVSFILTLAMIGRAAALVAPFSFETAPVQVPEGAPLTVVTVNLFVNSSDHEKLLRWIDVERPDIIVFEEMTAAFALRAAPLEAVYPHHRIIPHDDPRGIAIVSKFPLEAVEVFHNRSQMPQLRAVVLAPEGRIVVYGLHPIPPVSPALAEETEAFFDDLGRRIRAETLPVLVLADLNLTPWSPTFVRFTETAGLSDPRRGRGILPTWPDLPTYPVLAIPIDHVLYRGPFSIVELRVGPGFGSDHRPVLARLVRHRS